MIVLATYAHKLSPQNEKTDPPRLAPRVVPHLAPRVVPRLAPRVVPRLAPRVVPRVVPRIAPRGASPSAPRGAPRRPALLPAPPGIAAFTKVEGISQIKKKVATPHLSDRISAQMRLGTILHRIILSKGPSHCA